MAPMRFVEDPYVVKFMDGTTARIAELSVLKEFQRTWKWHHKLQPEQFAYAGRTAEIERHGIYHGGDVIYELKDVPGVWHQSCLSKAE